MVSALSNLPVNPIHPADTPLSRNCTKHQVRCDYMDQQRPEAEAQPPRDQLPVPTSPGTEHIIDIWQQTGNFPYPELQVFPPPQPQNHSRVELRLIQHLSSISRSLLMNSTIDMTIWTSRVPKCVLFLSLCDLLFFESR